MEDSQLVTTVANDYTVMRVSNSSSANRMTAMTTGAKDNVIWETDSYYQLRYGGWTLKENVTTSREILPPNVVTTATGFATSRTTAIRWKLPYFPAYTVRQLEDAFEITLYRTTDPQNRILLARNPLFLTATGRRSGENMVYTFPYKPGASLNGFSLSYEAGTLTLAFRNPSPLEEGSLPLAGKTILLDPGHGGGDPGATGPLGSLGDTEDDLSLRVGLKLRDKLEALGAAVIMTREDGDTVISLAERAALIRSARPIMAISLHHNSIDYSGDIGNTFGALTLYSEPLSAPLAASVQEELVKATGAQDRGASFQGLAVCRVYDCPSILVELGFITNPYEYENLAAESYIIKEAEGITNGILKYLGGEK
ncbi:MAG: N-acetylmuramoyl-L-alanine amidase [Clostridia bacterium]|nr:N-acetylmuramoyl-L-alanine amidase [Clostridia bacterium]